MIAIPSSRQASVAPADDKNNTANAHAVQRLAWLHGAMRRPTHFSADVSDTPRIIKHDHRHEGLVHLEHRWHSA